MFQKSDWSGGWLIIISVLVLPVFWEIIYYRCHYLSGVIWFSWDDYSCCRLLVITPAPGDCPHFGGGLSCKSHCCLRVVSVTCHKGVIDQSCPFCDPRWLRREWLRQTDTKWRQECQVFLLLLVNSWAQVGVSAFQQKQFKYCLHYQFTSSCIL
jgi:hypothetical protein